MAVVQTGPPDAPRLEVSGTDGEIGVARAPAVIAAVERLLGTRADVSAFHRFAARDPQLAPLAARFRGMRPPR